MKPAFVVDCSVTMAWLFEDERTEETSQIQDRLASEAAVVPVHWLLEVTNVLFLAEKRKRISVTTSAEFLRLLRGLEFEVDHDWKIDRIDPWLTLCRAHGLTSYDAVYLELAVRRQLPLATLDDNLRKAAKGVGVELLGK